MTIQSEPQKNFYAVLTSKVLYDKKITIRQKVLMAMISNMSVQTGYCWASNAYFADCLDCDERTIQRDLLALEELNILNRVINLKTDGSVDFRALFIMLDTVTPASGGGDMGVMGGGDMGVMYNNKDINNKYNSVSQDETDHTPNVVEKKKRAIKKNVEVDLNVVKKFYNEQIIVACNSSDQELASKYKAYVNYIFKDNVNKEPIKEMLSVKGQLTYDQYKDLVQLSANSRKGIKQAIEVGENTPNYWKNKETIFLTLKNWMSK
jgi:hypothetical protein